MTQPSSPTSITAQSKPLAAIIAGGQSRRMGGGDKGIKPLQEKMMISHVVDRIAPQSSSIVINANSAPEEYRSLNYPLIEDSIAGHLGPLAGVLSVLESFEDELVMILPCDTPLIPIDLIERMQARLVQSDSDLCTIEADGSLHPIFMLLKRKLAPSIREFLEAGERRVGFWLKQQNYCVADFSDQAEAFSNINTPEEFERISRDLNSDG
ncbi:MAG: molybdenum cofactor guanylyltransferase [Gammaproteobacteria bacterium]|nr:molybdenum cofactor guanylyltransferase [Gammaproteobacteria bacterium]